MKHVDQLNFFILSLFEGVLTITVVIVLLLYFSAAYLPNRKIHLSNWPKRRMVYFVAGILMSGAVMTGPLGELVHHDFRLHMVGHLLLGMLGPLLIVLAAPMTLLLRTLPVKQARFVSKILRSKLFSILSHPVMASFLNIGGLWLLYATNLFHLMHQHTWLYLFIHIHVFLAGYVFTASMIYIDPVSRRYSYLFRATVFIVALGAHQTLCKYIYANPPFGVDRAEAEIGAMLMYYGGDIIDLVIIYILCLHWYRSSRPKRIAV